MSWVPSIQVLTEKRLALHNEPGIPYSFWMVYVDLCTNFDGKHLWQQQQQQQQQKKKKKIHISLWLMNQIGWGFRRNADN